MRTLSTLLPLILLASMFATACTPSRDETIKAKAESQIKEAMNDPSSYEFVSFKLLDSVLYRDNAKRIIESSEMMLGLNQENVDRMLKYKNDEYLSSMYDAEELEKATRRLEESKADLAKLHLLIKGLGADTNNLASLTYAFSFRGSNAMGAKMLASKYVQTGPPPTYDILKIADREGELLGVPNSLPGLQEMYAKESLEQ